MRKSTNKAQIVPVISTIWESEIGSDNSTLSQTITWLCKS